MQNSMYYTTSGLTSLPAYQGGGYLDQYGRQQYGLGKLVRSITKPIAKVLDKVVPNEIKPALPFAAAFAPFLFPEFVGGLGSMLGGSGTIGGLSIPQMIGSGILKAGADLSQEGADKRGLNPLTLGATMLSAGLAAPGSAEAIGDARILGNIDGTAFTAADASKVIPTFGPEGSMLPPGQILTPTTYLQDAQNLLNTGLKGAAKIMEVPEGGISILNNPMEAAKKLAVPTVTTASEQAYIAAQKALDEYNSKLGNIQNMKSADLSERRNAVIKYMQLAGFGQSDIDSALLRSGLKKGGRAGYDSGGSTIPKFVPMDLESVALRLFGKNLDNLSFIEKQAVRDYIDDNKPKKAKGGIMNLGGKEMDLRAAGGFVPIGKKERADDVPARLSKNEFVFTAKAVRNAGGGDIRKGAKKMYQLMKHLEAR